MNMSPGFPINVPVYVITYVIPVRTVNDQKLDGGKTWI